jgi:hypothetical protein
MFVKSKNFLGVVWAVGVLSLFWGCAGPQMTSVNLDRNSNERDGMPYYLPKPYLFVTKNIRYIPTPTVGLTQTVPIPNSFNSTAGKDNAGGADTSTSPGKSGTAKTSPGDKANVQTAKSPQDGSSSGDTNSSGGSGNAYGNQVTGPSSVAVIPPAPISDGLVPQEFYTYQVVYLPDTTRKYGLRIKGGHGEFRATANFVNGWMYTGPGPFVVSTSTAAQDITATGQAVGQVAESVGQIVLNRLRTTPNSMSMNG